MRPSRRLSWFAVLLTVTIGGALAARTLPTDGPLTNFFSLFGRTDENGYVRVSVGTPGVTDGPLTAFGNLRGRTDENGYLRVSLASGSAVVPATTCTNQVIRAIATTGAGTCVSIDGNYIVSSVALAGSPTTTTQTAGDSSTKIATTAFVTTGIANAIAAVNPAVAVEAATTAVLPNSPAYLNGVTGIGATLISTVFGALTVDGYTVAVADRVLVKTQASTFQNGVYLVTATGGGAAFYTLTRALDFDQPSDMNDTGTIPVINGTVNVATQWLLTSRVSAVGTDAVTFTRFALNPATLITTADVGTVTGTMIASNVALAGSPTTTTQGAGDNSTKLATTAYADAAGAGVSPASYETATDFAATGRYFIPAAVGGASIAFDSGGANITTSATATSGQFLSWGPVSPITGVYAAALKVRYTLYTPTIGTDLQAFIGIGDYATSNGGAISFTTRHIGTKLIRAASGAITLSATQADGTTETATSLTTMAAGDQIAISFSCNGSSSCAFYWSKNFGAWSSATTLSANYPSAGSPQGLDFHVSNAATATNSVLSLAGAKVGW